MGVFDDKINEILKQYGDLRYKYKIDLEHSVDGCLRHQMKGKHIQFIHYVNDSGKKIRHGINRDTDLLKELARKEYNTKAYAILSNNIDALKDAITKQIPFDPEHILNSMTKAYALLPEEYFFDKDKLLISPDLNDDMALKIKRHEKWWKKPYKEYWGYPENKTKLTSRGQKVRSLSELLIAETLYKYSIPFHYEEVLETDGKTFAPDFTFEGCDYKKFYLDYFGMMDNPKYAKKNFLKLDDYYDIGLIPGDNLIVAFNSKGIMNAGVIDAIIQNEVIPRL